MLVEKLTIKDTFRQWRDKINYLIDKIAKIPATDDDKNYVLDEYSIGAKNVIIDIPVTISSLSIKSNIDCFGYEITTNKVHSVVNGVFADFFPKGEETEDGDIIALDSSKSDSYVKATKDSVLIVGVHSDTYGYILGGVLEDGSVNENFEENFIPVGLKGRTYVKFSGKSQLGEGVVPSEIPGVGCLYDPSINTDNQIVGYIVEDSSETEDLRKVKILIR